MGLKFLKYIFYLAVAFLLQYTYDAAGQEAPRMENSCDSHISIHGSSNINQFQLINHNPEIVRFSDKGDDEKRDQRVEISVNQFKAANKRIREDFLEMVNAPEYPFIIMAIEPRVLAECRNEKGLSDFKTKITIAGVSKRFVVPCGIDSCDSSGYVLKGRLEIKLTDFGIDPPKKLLGIIKVDNEVLIDYVFRFRTDDDIFRVSMREKPGFYDISTIAYASGKFGITAVACVKHVSKRLPKQLKVLPVLTGTKKQRCLQLISTVPIQL